MEIKDAQRHQIIILNAQEAMNLHRQEVFTNNTQHNGGIMARIDDLLDSLTMAELRAITESLLLKREHDGLNGRPFDALKHMKYEDRVSDILRIRLRGLKTQNKSED